MLKFLMTLLGVIDKLLGAWQAHHWKRQGHQEATKEAAHEIEQQIALGEAANDVPDPVRTDRLRSKYDRSRSAQ